MPKKTKLKPKFVFRRFVLIVLSVALVGGIGWYLGQGGFLAGGDEETADGTLIDSISQDAADNETSSNETSDEEKKAVDEEGGDQGEPVSTVDASVFGDWNLILVNYENLLPENFSVNLKTIYEADGRIFQIDERTYDEAYAMFTQAKLDGIDIYPTSAHRAVDYQQGLFNAKVEEYMETGYDEDAAIATTATIIAVPGTSEHHTGLAIDIITPSYTELDEGFAETAAFKWLDENAHKYGYILRYPANKQEITQIIYEPWHYRYVGVEHAAFMKENGYCLEEYIYLLRTNQLSQQAEPGEDGNEDNEDPEQQ